MKTVNFDALVEAICAEGCKHVYQTISLLEKQESYPDALAALTDSERQHILEELKSIMDVYGGNVCSL